ncbi:MAG: hypothetical protein KBD76_10295 [Bacteriovorax sp.]|jgi:hypothetical protein|nr:hypothetical protein [Bacteriovorax sp.]
MKIPIFEEIPMSEITSEKLRIIISDSRIGKVPTYLNLTNLKKDEAEQFILDLEHIALENNLHPLFPYPLYIVSPHSLKGLFPTVKAVKELPEHYFKKIKRPNNREIQLLNKLSLKVDKINNLELFKILKDFKEGSLEEKNLYEETKELYFLENLHTRIIGRRKN